MRDTLTSVRKPHAIRLTLLLCLWLIGGLAPAMADCSCDPPCEPDPDVGCRCPVGPLPPPPPSGGDGGDVIELPDPQAALAAITHRYTTLLQSLQAQFGGLDAYINAAPITSDGELSIRLDSLNQLLQQWHANVATRRASLQTENAVLDTALATLRAELADATARLAQLEAEHSSLSTALSTTRASLATWTTRQSAVQTVTENYRQSITLVQEDVFNLFEALSPPGTLVASRDSLVASRGQPLSPASLAPGRASEPMPDFAAPGRAVDPPVPQVTASPLQGTAEEKIATLEATAQSLSQSVADERALSGLVTQKRTEAEALRTNSMVVRRSFLLDQNSRLGQELAGVSGQLRYAKEDCLRARDNLMNNVVTHWVWKKVQEDLVYPAAKQMLRDNGMGALADELHIGTIVDWFSVKDKIKWVPLESIQNMQDFLKTQKLTLDLLDPWKSRVLESAEVNGLVTSEAGAQLNAEIDTQFDAETAQFIETAGQVDMPDVYRPLLDKLLGWTGPRKSPDEL
jgi:hypothetical protein